MAEHKKPFPANKHETRLVTESRPAGIAASMYREEAGSSIDMVEIVGEKPRVVRVSQGAYEGLVRDGTEFFRNDYQIAAFNDPPVAPALWGPWHTIGTVIVPLGMAFDLTAVQFVVTSQLSAAGVQDTNEALPDYGVGGIYAFRLTINNILPWASYTIFELLGLSFPGHFQLNTNMLDFGNDCPVHVVTTEGQVLRFEMTQVTANNPTTYLVSGAITAMPRGRWIPIQHYNRIVHANRLE